jgi:hypothetical protein
MAVKRYYAKTKAGSSFGTHCGVQIGLETGLTELLRDKTML